MTDHGKGHIRDQGRRQTTTSMVGIQVPPEGYRLALEDYKGSVCTPQDTSNYHDHPYDPDVYRYDGNPKEKKANGDLEDACGERIEDFAKVPEAKSLFSICICNVFTMASSSVGCSAYLAREVRCV